MKSSFFGAAVFLLVLVTACGPAASATTPPVDSPQNSGQAPAIESTSHANDALTEGLRANPTTAASVEPQPLTATGEKPEATAIGDIITKELGGNITVASVDVDGNVSTKEFSEELLPNPKNAFRIVTTIVSDNGQVTFKPVEGLDPNKPLKPIINFRSTGPVTHNADGSIEFLVNNKLFIVEFGVTALLGAEVLNPGPAPDTTCETSPALQAQMDAIVAKAEKEGRSGVYQRLPSYHLPEDRNAVNTPPDTLLIESKGAELIVACDLSQYNPGARIYATNIPSEHVEFEDTKTGRTFRLGQDNRNIQAVINYVVNEGGNIDKITIHENSDQDITSSFKTDRDIVTHIIGDGPGIYNYKEYAIGYLEEGKVAPLNQAGVDHLKAIGLKMSDTSNGQ